MRLMPILEGGLRIEIETPTDWLVLEQIPNDALDGGDDQLSQRLGALMDDQSEWEEVVVPELKSFFNGQVSLVTRSVQEAQAMVETGGEEVSGSVSISKEEANEWYGALNQARLALEARYQFGEAEEVEELDAFSPEKRSAFVRNQFYVSFQSILLDYVMGC